jgi:hypothetical protein
LCYWVLPFTLVGIAGLISGLFPGWFEKQSALVDQRQVAESPNVAMSCWVYVASIWGMNITTTWALAT